MSTTFKLGDYVRFTDANAHSRDPDVHPKVDTLGILATGITSHVWFVQWPDGTDRGISRVAKDDKLERVPTCDLAVDYTGEVHTIVDRHTGLVWKFTR